MRPVLSAPSRPDVDGRPAFARGQGACRGLGITGTGRGRFWRVRWRKVAAAVRGSHGGRRTGSGTVSPSRRGEGAGRRTAPAGSRTFRLCSRTRRTWRAPSRDRGRRRSPYRARSQALASETGPELDSYAFVRRAATTNVPFMFSISPHTLAKPKNARKARSTAVVSGLDESAQGKSAYSRDLQA